MGNTRSNRKSPNGMHSLRSKYHLLDIFFNCIIMVLPIADSATATPVAPELYLILTKVIMKLISNNLCSLNP